MNIKSIQRPLAGKKLIMSKKDDARITSDDEYQGLLDAIRCELEDALAWLDNGNIPIDYLSVLRDHCEGAAHFSQQAIERRHDIVGNRKTVDQLVESLLVKDTLAGRLALRSALENLTDSDTKLPHRVRKGFEKLGFPKTGNRGMPVNSYARAYWTYGDLLRSKAA